MNKVHIARSASWAFGALLTIAVATTTARGAGVVTQFNPSIRAAGMGEAGSAVFWSNDVNEWANPALLSYQTGFQYRWGTTRLVPDFASDVHFRTHRFDFGWGGLGVASSSHTIDYGESEGMDDQGNVTGTFSSQERVRPTGIGVSTSGLVAAIAALGGGEAPAFTRFADLAFGYDRKSWDIDLGPGPGSQASANASDYGVLARVSPLPGGKETPSVDLAYAFSALNYDDAEVVFLNAAFPDFIDRQYRNGLAARLAFPSSPQLTQAFAGLVGPWIARGMTPWISIGAAYDFVHFQTGEGSVDDHDVDEVGLEVDLLRVLAVRVGHVSDQLGEIVGMTYGFGIGVPLGGVAGVRYDFASTPEARGLTPLQRHAISAWFDPVAFARR